MVYHFLADLVVVLHFCFILFVVLGGFLVLWKTSMAWLHIPAVIWGAGIEFAGCICPLTPLENLLRARGGEPEYGAGFVQHYIIPFLYPAILTRTVQIGLGIIVLVINCIIYLLLWQRTRKVKKPQGNYY